MCAHRVMRTALNYVKRFLNGNNAKIIRFRKENSFSGFFFLDANIANALLIMSLIMKNLFFRNFKGKGKKDCGKKQGILGEKIAPLLFFS